MVTPEEIKVLEGCVDFGDDAKKLLKYNNELIERMEKLKKLHDDKQPISQINFLVMIDELNYGSDNYRSIHIISDTNFAMEKINEIIKHEILILCADIFGLTLPDKFVE